MLVLSLVLVLVLVLSLHLTCHEIMISHDDNQRD